MKVTKDQIRKWVEAALKEETKDGDFSEKGVAAQVQSILDRALSDIIKDAAGLEQDTWSHKWKLVDHRSATPIFKTAEQTARNYLAKALVDYPLELSPAELNSIRSAYKKAFIRKAEEVAYQIGAALATEKVPKLVEEVLEEIDTEKAKPKTPKAQKPKTRIRVQ